MTQTVKIDNGQDVVSFLKSQHEQVKSMFPEVMAASGSEREAAFMQLRRMLAVHETAEEEIVHPRAKSEIPNGDAVVAERLKEENAAKKALAELEEMDVDSTEFETAFAALQSDVIAHAEAEETQEFNMLGDALDDDKLQRMRRAAELAESMAPTRPHAGVDSKTANLMVGPFAAMLDRARDAISGTPH